MCVCGGGGGGGGGGGEWTKGSKNAVHTIVSCNNQLAGVILRHN